MAPHDDVDPESACADAEKTMAGHMMQRAALEGLQAVIDQRRPAG